MLSSNILGLIFLLIFFIIQIQSKPVVSSTNLIAQDSSEEIMETAESQNPFLPRFVMKRLKERREQARAQRRTQYGQKRSSQQHKAKDCPQRRYYRK